MQASVIMYGIANPSEVLGAEYWVIVGRRVSEISRLTDAPHHPALTVETQPPDAQGAGALWLLVSLRSMP
jgi:hypothetical protein